jgi:hypothetical protein
MEGGEDSGFTTSNAGVDVSVAPFPLEQHNSEIQNELICIERAAYFLKVFYAFCKDRSVPAYDRTWSTLLLDSTTDLILTRFPLCRRVPCSGDWGFDSSVRLCIAERGGRVRVFAEQRRGDVSG